MDKTLLYILGGAAAGFAAIYLYKTINQPAIVGPASTYAGGTPRCALPGQSEYVANIGCTSSCAANCYQQFGTASSTALNNCLSNCPIV